MGIRISFSKRVLNFNFKARTSRGLMRDKTSWFIKAWNEVNPEVFGLGECGPLPGLSIDSGPEFETVLSHIVAKSLDPELPLTLETIPAYVPAAYPTITFGLETAILDLMNGGKRIIYNNSFIKRQPIPINGLIWMGDMDFMMNQINTKIAAGFRCIKLKVGGLDFDRECDILSYLRKRYFRENIAIRLDANGAFKVDEVLYKLGELEKYNIQSIEQPIKAGLAEMEELCRKSPIPIALDEELIGKEISQQRELLERLKPQYIVLKPSLHGGLRGCAEWITLAESMGCGWWMTSALESNIGLNAICQFTAQYAIHIPQGLGTGSIYENNIASPLRVEKGNIFFDEGLSWVLDKF